MWRQGDKEQSLPGIQLKREVFVPFPFCFPFPKFGLKNHVPFVSQKTSFFGNGTNFVFWEWDQLRFLGTKFGYLILGYQKNKCFIPKIGYPILGYQKNKFFW
jgi:hypothetical protein